MLRTEWLKCGRVLRRMGESLPVLLVLSGFFNKFICFSDPNPPDLDEIDWEPVSSPDELLYLNINYRHMTMQSNPNAKRMDFWDEFFNEFPRL